MSVRLIWAPFIPYMQCLLVGTLSHLVHEWASLVWFGEHPWHLARSRSCLMIVPYDPLWNFKGVLQATMYTNMLLLLRLYTDKPSGIALKHNWKSLATNSLIYACLKWVVTLDYQSVNSHTLTPLGCYPWQTLYTSHLSDLHQLTKLGT